MRQNTFLVIFLLLIAPPQIGEVSASTAAPQELEAIVCNADAIVVAQILEASDGERDMAEEKTSSIGDCDIAIWVYKYHVNLLGVVRGSIQPGEADGTFINRSSLNCSFTVQSSGLETGLKRKEKYLLLLSKEVGKPYIILRAEHVKQRDRVIKLLSTKVCDKQK